MRSFFIQTTMEIHAEDERSAIKHVQLMIKKGDDATDDPTRETQFVRVTGIVNAFGERHTVECNNTYREGSGERRCICPKRL